MLRTVLHFTASTKKFLRRKRQQFDRLETYYFNIDYFTYIQNTNNTFIDISKGVFKVLHNKCNNY